MYRQQISNGNSTAAATASWQSNLFRIFHLYHLLDVHLATLSTAKSRMPFGMCVCWRDSCLASKLVAACAYASIEPGTNYII